VQGTVLVVDDHVRPRRALATELEDVGFRCFEAGDGEEAWQLFCHLTPDLVISDMVMPHLDGLDLLTRIRAVDARLDSEFEKADERLVAAEARLRRSSTRLQSKLESISVTASGSLVVSGLVVENDDGESVVTLGGTTSGGGYLSIYDDEEERVVLLMSRAAKGGLVELYDADGDLGIAMAFNDGNASIVLDRDLGNTSDPDIFLGFGSADNARLHLRQGKRGPGVVAVADGGTSALGVLRPRDEMVFQAGWTAGEGTHVMLYDTDEDVVWSRTAD